MGTVARLQFPDAGLTARQKSEIAYHSTYAARHRHLAETPVDLNVCVSEQRRWWNSYWSLYDIIRAMPLAGKRVLVPGCGFGEDCLRLAALGADVYGIDLSPEIIDIARRRAKRFAARPVHLDVMPCEDLDYPDGFFDAVVLVNILHHVDIPATMAEVRRVAKPGAQILGVEMYTHTAAQSLRETKFLTQVVYPRVKRLIYGGIPYITPDERKIDQHELRDITGGLTNRRTEYFCIFADRFFSMNFTLGSKIDQFLARALGGIAGWAAGRVIFAGTWPGQRTAERAA